MGDLHMPLHLTGRERGGNEGTVFFSFTLQSPLFYLVFLVTYPIDRVRFDGRITSASSETFTIEIAMISNSVTSF